MKVIARAACLCCFASMLCLAGDWSGWLVSAKCFASMDANRNDIERSWDGNFVVRYCTPDKDTKSFAVMRQDDSPIAFDSAGNEKAAELPLSLGNTSCISSRYRPNNSGTQLKSKELRLSRVYLAMDPAHLVCDKPRGGIDPQTIRLRVLLCDQPTQ